jgi:hypothetical protein
MKAFVAVCAVGTVSQCSGRQNYTPLALALLTAVAAREVPSGERSVAAPPGIAPADEQPIRAQLAQVSHHAQEDIVHQSYLDLLPWSSSQFM